MLKNCRKVFYFKPTRNLYSKFSLMAPKVLLTSTLPPESQKLIESVKDIELIQWKNENGIPREKLLELVKGQSHYLYISRKLPIYLKWCFYVFISKALMEFYVC